MQLYKEDIFNSFISGIYEKCYGDCYRNAIYFDYYKLDYIKTAKIANVLENDTFINHISFHNCGINNESAIYLFEKLHHNNTIEILRLHGNKLEDGAFAALSKLLEVNKTIKVLDIGSIKIKNSINYIFKIITTNKVLTSINLSRSGIKNTDLKILAKAFKYNSSIKELYLYNNNILNENNCKYLLKLLRTNLKKINLHTCKISSQHINYIFNEMKINKNLTDLILSYNEITSENIISLYNFIKYNKTLKNLDLEYNKFNNNDGKLILQALKFNKTLCTLNLAQRGFVNPLMPDIDDSLRISDSVLKKINTLLYSRCQVSDSINNIIHAS